MRDRGAEGQHGAGAPRDELARGRRPEHTLEARAADRVCRRTAGL